MIHGLLCDLVLTLPKSTVNDDKTSSNTVPLCVPLKGVDPGTIRRGGGVSHRVSSET
jgi:hypothetical protein